MNDKIKVALVELKLEGIQLKYGKCALNLENEGGTNLWVDPPTGWGPHSEEPAPYLFEEGGYCFLVCTNHVHLYLNKSYWKSSCREL